MKYGIDAEVTPGTWTIPADVRAAVDAMTPVEYDALIEDATDWFCIGEPCSVADLSDYMRNALNIW